MGIEIMECYFLRFCCKMKKKIIFMSIYLCIWIFFRNFACKIVYDMKVVLLAGGFGSRISEESIFRPKPMNKNYLEHNKTRQ